MSRAWEVGPDLSGQLGPKTEPSEGQNQKAALVRTALHSPAPPEARWRGGQKAGSGVQTNLAPIHSLPLLAHLTSPVTRVPIT